MLANLVRITQDCGQAGIQFTGQFILDLPCPPLPLVNKGYGPNPPVDAGNKRFAHIITWSTRCSSAELMLGLGGLDGVGWCGGFTLELKPLAVAPYAGGIGPDYTCSVNKYTLQMDLVVDKVLYDCFDNFMPLAGTWCRTTVSCYMSWTYYTEPCECGGYKSASAEGVKLWSLGNFPSWGNKSRSMVGEFTRCQVYDSCFPALQLELKVPRHVFSGGVCKPLMGTFLTLVGFQIDHEYDALGPCHEYSASPECYKRWSLVGQDPCVYWDLNCYPGGELYGGVNCSQAGYYKNVNARGLPTYAGWFNGFYNWIAVGHDPMLTPISGPTACVKDFTALGGLDHINPGGDGEVGGINISCTRDIVFNLEAIRVEFNLNHVGSATSVPAYSTLFGISFINCSMATVCVAQVGPQCSAALSMNNQGYCDDVPDYYPRDYRSVSMQYGDKIFIIQCGKVMTIRDA